MLHGITRLLSFLFWIYFYFFSISQAMPLDDGEETIDSIGVSGPRYTQLE